MPEQGGMGLTMQGGPAKQVPGIWEIIWLLGTPFCQ